MYNLNKKMHKRNLIRQIRLSKNDQEQGLKTGKEASCVSGNAWNPRTLSPSHTVSMSERKGWRTDRYLTESPGKHQSKALHWPLKTVLKTSSHFPSHKKTADWPTTIGVFFWTVYTDKGTFEPALWEEAEQAAWYIWAEHVKLLWLQWTQFSTLSN